MHKNNTNKFNCRVNQDRLADAHIVISQKSTDEGTLYAAISNEQITKAVETFSGFKLEEDKLM